MVIKQHILHKLDKSIITQMERRAQQGWTLLTKI